MTSGVPFFRYCLFFTSGIILYLCNGFTFSFILLFGSCVGYCCFHSLKKITKKDVQIPLGICGLLFLFLLGNICASYKYTLSLPSHPPSMHHYQWYVGTVDDELIDKDKTTTTTLKISYVKSEKGWVASSGKVKAYFSHVSTINNLKYGCVLLLKGCPQAVPPPTNPDQFNYRSYLSYKGTHLQHFIQAGQWIIVDFQPSSWFWENAFAARNYLKGTIKRFLPEKIDYAIASALLFGIRTQIDESVQNAFASAGALHILAVSGMHVGLVAIFLSYMFGWLRNKGTYGVWIYSILVLLCIWSYGFVTGMAPSIVRALWMFTVYIIAQVLKRRSNNANNLCFAAFIILLCDPLVCTDVGFQLSFMAVAGITVLYPFFYQGYIFSTRWADSLWSITCMCLAAQITTFPICLYYFHQFPVYFLLANIWVVPLGTAITYVGVGFLIFHTVPFFNTLFAKVLQWLIHVLVASVQGVQWLPGSLCHSQGFDLVQLGILSGIIVLLLGIFVYKKNVLIYFVIVLSAAFAIFRIHYFYSQQFIRSLVFYAVPGSKAIGFLQQNEAYIWIDLKNKFPKKAFTFYIKPYLAKNGYSSTINSDTHNSRVFEGFIKIPGLGMATVWNGKSILILHEQAHYYSRKIAEFDYVLVANDKEYKKALPIVKASTWVCVQCSSNTPVYNLHTKGALKISI